MQIGIVGLPFSGKSTLFQTITRTHLDPSALARSETHQAIVRVPDSRLDKLAGVFTPKKTVNATIEFVDVVGLKKGDSGSTQFTTSFLTNVRTNDALVQVVRLFEDATVAHPEGSVDILRDISSFETEFLLSDMAVVESRIERIRKNILKTGDEIGKRELPTLERCNDLLQAGTPLREAELTKEDLAVLKTYQFLTAKPMLVALNGDETQLSEIAKHVEAVRAEKDGRNTKVLSFFGKIEMEMSELPGEEAALFMTEYGITESALDTLLREAYDLLGLQSFFTVGEDECRAWTIRKGMTAQESAGVIHSDFENKFIRAEVVHYDDFMASGGSFAKAKEQGLWRLEGKEYVVNEGDIISIRHG
jgi:GTP-binding protein YchF